MRRSLSCSAKRKGGGTPSQTSMTTNLARTLRRNLSCGEAVGRGLGPPAGAGSKPVALQRCHSLHHPGPPSGRLGEATKANPDQASQSSLQSFQKPASLTANMQTLQHEIAGRHLFCPRSHSGNLATISGTVDFVARMQSRLTCGRLRAC